MTGRAVFNLVLLPFLIHNAIGDIKAGYWWLFSISVATVLWCAIDFAVERFKKP